MDACKSKDFATVTTMLKTTEVDINLKDPVWPFICSFDIKLVDYFVWFQLGNT